MTWLKLEAPDSVICSLLPHGLHFQTDTQHAPHRPGPDLSHVIFFFLRLLSRLVTGCESARSKNPKRILTRTLRRQLMWASLIIFELSFNNSVKAKLKSTGSCGLCKCWSFNHVWPVVGNFACITYCSARISKKSLARRIYHRMSGNRWTTIKLLSNSWILLLQKCLLWN